MKTHEPQTSSGAPLWEFVPLSSYEPHVGEVRDAMVGGVRGLWASLFQAESEPAMIQQELAMLSSTEMALCAPEPDWTEPVPALQAALADWLDVGKQLPIHQYKAAFVVGQPYSGHQELLVSLARELSWRVIEPPEDVQILSQDDSWLAQFASDEGPWVLPDLGLCYLRHVNGLGLLRKLLDRSACGALERGIIGCSAWAWKYLGHVWRGDRTPAWAMNPFNGEKLAMWFAQQAGLHGPIFRELRSGNAILNAPEVATSMVSPEAQASSTPPQADKGVQVGPFFRKLASYSRGSPGVAYALWRRALRDISGDASAKDAVLAESDEASANNDSLPSDASAPTPYEGDEKTLWVVSIEEVTPPPISPLTRGERAMVLQTLLLHGALRAETLEQLLPLSASETIQTLSSLHQMGHVGLEQGHWSVCPHALPDVRRFLNDKGYMVDDL